MFGILKPAEFRYRWYFTVKTLFLSGWLTIVKDGINPAFKQREECHKMLLLRPEYLGETLFVNMVHHYDLVIKGGAWSARTATEIKVISDYLNLKRHTDKSSSPGEAISQDLWEWLHHQSRPPVQVQPTHTHTHAGQLSIDLDRGRSSGRSNLELLISPPKL